MPTRKPPSTLAAAAGTVTVLCLPFFSPLVSLRHTAVYHEQGPAWHFFLPILADGIALWLLFAGILKLIRRWRWLRVVFWAAMTSLLPLMVLKTILMDMRTTPLGVVKEVLFCCCLLAFLSLLVQARRSAVIQVERALHIAEVSASMVAWSGVLLLGQTLWFMEAARPTPEPALLKSAAPAPIKPTVLWILFDELSEDQLFDHRSPGLELPAFDRFAAQSTIFSHAIPTNLYTEAAVPALLTGQPVKSIESSSDGRRLTLDLTSGVRQPFDAQQTVFGDAKRLGYLTSVDGWFNPYCRILAGVLDRCTWTAHHIVLPGGLHTETFTGRDFIAPVATLFPYLMHLFVPHYTSAEDRASRDHHIDEYRKIVRDAQPLLQDPHPGFVMLHIPAPHPEGIYNRRTGTFATDSPSSYLDNLALADRFLGEVAADLAATHAWEDATVVIMGDHSWRTRPMWRGLPLWTPEDEQASQHGVFDPRPAYLVKLPHQHAPSRIDQPFDALRNRALFDQLLAGNIHTPAQLQDWAAHP